MKKIAIIVSCLYSGGAERAAGALSKYLDKYFKVYLFLADPEHIVYGYGGTIIDFGMDGPDYFEYYIGLYKERYEIDCAISFMEPFNFMNIRTKKNEKVIISERCVQSLFEGPYCHENYQIRALYNKADMIISVAEGVKYDLIHSYGIDKDKIKTIYNFIDQEDIKKKADLGEGIDLAGFLGDAKLIVNIGRLTNQKDQQRLIKQLAVLLRERKDIRSLIIGSGILEDKLIALIKSLGLENYIKILTYCKNPFPYLKRADIFVLTSKNEGLPNVLLEAMSLGIPIVSTDCMSGPRELLAGETSYEEKTRGFRLCERGILVEDTTSEDDGTTCYLKEALSCMLDDRAYADSVIRRGSEYIEGYSNERILHEWICAIEGPQSTKSKECVDMPTDKKVVVYGAGDYGRRMVSQLIRDNIEVFAIAVTDTKDNPSAICKIPVRMIDDLCSIKNTIRIVIGVSERYQSEIVEKLLSLGFDDFQFISLRPVA